MPSGIRCSVIAAVPAFQPALRWLPIATSALLFALAHVGHGPAPIPLFLLALGLGYVYQQTHRIMPSLTIHFLVNLVAVVELAAHVAG